MDTVQKLSSPNEIITKYDVFLFDLCGVVHDGVRLLPDAVDFIYHLENLKKDIVFLSNSSKPSERMKEFLTDLGMKVSERWKVVTSGEFFKHTVQNDPSVSIRNQFLNIGTKFEYFEGMSMNFVDDVKKADYLVITLIAEQPEEIEKWRPQLEEAAKLGIHALCINPDLKAPDGDIEVYTPGYFAREYSRMGGQVSYFGKPHTPIYEFALGEFLKKRIPRQKILATGDALITDVRGASKFGIDSLLLLRKGLHKDLLGKDIDDIYKKCEDLSIFPTYVVDTMSIS